MAINWDDINKAELEALKEMDNKKRAAEDSPKQPAEFICRPVVGGKYKKGDAVQFTDSPKKPESDSPKNEYTKRLEEEKEKCCRCHLSSSIVVSPVRFQYNGAEYKLCGLCAIDLRRFLDGYAIHESFRVHPRLTKQV